MLNLKLAFLSRLGNFCTRHINQDGTDRTYFYLKTVSLRQRRKGLEQRDLIKDQIEQMGKAIANVIANFLGLKSQGSISQAVEVSNKALKTQVDIDIDELTTLSGQKLKDYLSIKKLTPDHIEKLADYLIEIGKYQQTMNLGKAINSLKSVLELLSIVNKGSSIYSLERKSKENNTRLLLQECQKAMSSD